MEVLNNNTGFLVNDRLNLGKKIAKSLKILKVVINFKTSNIEHP